MKKLTKKTQTALVTRRTLQADQHPVATYLGRLGRNSRRVQGQALRKIAELLSGGQADAFHVAWWKLRYQHTAAVRAKLTETHAPASVNRMLAALRCVLKEAWRLGLMTAEDYRRAADIGTVKGSTLPAGRALSGGEIIALFAACEADTTAAGPRDAALFSLLYAGGLRRAEAVAVALDDYNAETGELRVRRGKGSKDRTAWLNESARVAVDAWILERGGDPGPLLCPVRKGGQILFGPMTDQAVFYRLRRRAQQAGIAGCSPHDLRRTFISDLLDRGADISTAQYLAGHSSVDTTTKYDRRPEETKRRAADLLHVPYRAPKKSDIGC